MEAELIVPQPLTFLLSQAKEMTLGALIGRDERSRAREEPAGGPSEVCTPQRLAGQATRGTTGGTPMSKLSRRLQREPFKEKRKAVKKAQRALCVQREGRWSDATSGMTQYYRHDLRLRIFLRGRKSFRIRCRYRGLDVE